MNEQSMSEVWKVRTIKNYPEAHNHLLVGKVLEITDSYVRMHCRSYHYGRVVNNTNDIQIGDVMIRVIPWSRIEIINELPSSFNYVRGDIVADKEGQVLFQDNQHTCSLVTTFERRY
jgi:hypothetical protein